MSLTELRLLVHAAGARGEKFHITYTLLPPVVDEVGWHAPPGGASQTGTLTPNPTGGFNCVEWTGVHFGGGDSGSESAGGGLLSSRIPCLIYNAVFVIFFRIPYPIYSMLFVILLFLFLTPSSNIIVHFFLGRSLSSQHHPSYGDVNVSFR